MAVVNLISASSLPAGCDPSKSKEVEVPNFKPLALKITIVIYLFGCDLARHRSSLYLVFFVQALSNDHVKPLAILAPA